MKTKIGIIGGAGYTAGELIRLLLQHSKVELTSVVSQSQFGKPISTIHRDLIGETNLTFSKSLEEEVEVIFLCQGHGRSAEYVEKYPQCLDKYIIDLSTDFRPRLNRKGFIYGLPELNRNAIQQAQYIANPGCFATAIQLALLPLVQHGLVQDNIHIHGITGSTGAGQRPSPTTHFAWRNNNVSIYKSFEHQHLEEITASLKQVKPDFDQELFFVPIRGNFSRGILISAYTPCNESLETILDLYQAYYTDHPFTHVTDEAISVKDVANTNKCLIQVSKKKGQVHLTAVIDNLLKGASGQALQNLNLIQGWEEVEGLGLKAIAF